MAYLQKSYCRIIQEQLWDWEQTIKHLQYHPDMHVNVICNAIKKFQDFFTITLNEKIDEQLVQIKVKTITIAPLNKE